MTKIRTRFAPSPTGSLHIGSLRTALFAYLTAKSLGGEYILRIEDTDQKRLVPGAVESLLNILEWAGIKFDEGPHIGGNYGPYIQSERKEIYRKYYERLLEEGKAYRCFCTAERLTEMREVQQKRKLPPRYDKKCANLSVKEINERLKKREKYVIRQRMPESGEVLVNDELRGEIRFRAQDLEDHVLVKSDGLPTYHFALVVDDHLMEITHVVRGEEWIPSFPKHILLYKDFNWQPPKFIHMPLTLNKGGGKLSKRHGDVAVEQYRDKGYLPEALLNFCALLGWHPSRDALAKINKPEDDEIFSLDEMVKIFDYRDMGTSAAVFDLEKLDFTNGYYIRQMDLDKLALMSKPFLADNLDKTAETDRKTISYIEKVVRLEQERMKKLSEVGELTEFFFVDSPEYDKDLLVWKKLTLEQVKNNLFELVELLEKVPEENWTEHSLEDAIISHLKSKDLKVGDYLWPMRVALTGHKASPGPFEVAGVLGKADSLKRLQAAVKKL